MKIAPAPERTVSEALIQEVQQCGAQPAFLGFSGVAPADFEELYAWLSRHRSSARVTYFGASSPFPAFPYVSRFGDSGESQILT